MKLSHLVANILLIGASLVILLPVAWVVLSSVSPMSDLLSNSIHLLPSRWLWSNYAVAWKSQPFGVYLFNSLFSNGLIVIAQLITSSLGAYAFVFIPFRGKSVAFFAVMLGMMVPLQAIFIPIYLMLSQVHFIDTYQGLVLPFVGSAFGIFLLRQGFSSIPKELIAAARVDGASELRILLSIVLGNAKPALITLALLNFVYHYNQLFWPLIATNSAHMRVVPVGLSYFLSQEAGSELQWNLMMAADVFTVIPVLLLFLLGQKYIVKGVTGYGVKG